jgi:hypothetical protein
MRLSARQYFKLRLSTNPKELRVKAPIQKLQSYTRTAHKNEKNNNDY